MHLPKLLQHQKGLDVTCKCQQQLHLNISKDVKQCMLQLWEFVWKWKKWLNVIMGDRYNVNLCATDQNIWD